MTDTIDRPQADGDRVLDHLIVRFAGDSGDGMQLTGDRFTSVSASFGNDLSTMPDFPAEIRAHAGTVNGVSAFQVNIADHDITTPGDDPNVLVAMNPAALKADLHRLEPGGTVIVNEDAFEERNLEKAGYLDAGGTPLNPLDDDTLNGYRVLKVPMSSLTKKVCEPLGVKPRDAERSKNFFALGLVSWMYTRPTGPTEEWIQEKFGKNEKVAAANKAAFHAGFHFGETTEAVGHRFEVRPAKLPAGEYTSITGNTALSWGLIAAGQQANLHSRSARTRSHQQVTSSTNSRSTSTSAFAPSKPKTKSRPSVLRSALRSPGTWQSQPPAVPVWRSRARRSRWHSPSNCHSSSLISNAAGRPPAFPLRPRPPISTLRSTADMAKRPCPWLRRTAQRNASTPPSRRPA